MQRRSFVACSAGIAAGLAGCAGVLENSGGSNDGGDGPDHAARALFEAAFDGNIEEANTYVHSDADIEPLQQSDVEQFQSADAQVESVTVVDRTGDTATVEVAMSAQSPDTAERVTETFRLELRQDGGAWKVYGSASSSGDRPSGPMTQWETAERTDADGSITAVEFTHAAGDGVDSGSLLVRADGDTVAAPSGTGITAGTTLVVPLDGGGNSLSTSTDVRLIWSSSDGDTSRILATHALTSPSVGTLGESIRIDG